ncbi:unnamed protein product [Prorocentrum cordatum]|uniref:SHSP domain-containing protein n=1 Tax=Prorocentrum cordatum TaxID=2364126 RepID=A0ABN9Y333_9DINO|nr:unnamed protein product [Polarella glacialis]
MKAIGDGTGALGEASHFQIEDNEGGMRITAQLPGHQMGSAGPHPLRVRVVGRTTLIVKGAHLNPPIMTEFQRSFNLPRRVALSRITVDYSTSTGKLLITVPPRLVAAGEAEDRRVAPGRQGGRQGEPQRRRKEPEPLRGHRGEDAQVLRGQLPVGPGGPAGRLHVQAVEAAQRGRGAELVRQDRRQEPRAQ